jgi:hypothetical protein
VDVGLHDGFELDGRQPTEAGLTATPVVGPLDPGHDRDPQFFASGPDPSVEDVLLQQREEALHRGVVAA